MVEPSIPAAALEQCSIYVHDLHHAHNFHLLQEDVPPNWEHAQYATELWLQRALEGHPWRVATPESADLIFVAANLSLFCVVSTYKQRELWSKLTTDTFLYPIGGVASANRSNLPRKFVTLQYQGCKPPWIAKGHKRPPGDVIMLKEYVGKDRRRAVVSPFVVSQPPWLVEGHDGHEQGTRSRSDSPPPPSHVPWGARKLIFFAGHVPKPYISPTRYLLWRQTRRDPRVTAVSSTLSCQVGTFATCSLPEAYLRAQNNSFWLTHCHHLCGTKTTCMSSARRKPEANMQGFLRACVKVHGPRQLRNANFSDELADMIRDTRRVPHTEYLKLAMSHRFCLIAPGDWVSTHKITEAMALGGAGGCIPLFVAPGNSRDTMEDATSSMLPYTRWHDYCTTSYFISEYIAKLNFSAVLDRLERISETEAARKLAALRRVRDAYVFRHGATVQHPSAAHYILGEACAAARRQRTGAAEVRRTDLSGCVLQR